MKDIIVWAEVNVGELVIEEMSVVLSLISNVNKKDRNFINIYYKTLIEDLEYASMES